MKIESLVIYLLVINFITLIAFIIDKKNAIKHRYRISEKILFFLSLIGGSVGALVGMYVFRHKSKKLKFVIGIPLILVMEVIIILYLLVRENVL